MLARVFFVAKIGTAGESNQMKKQINFDQIRPGYLRRSGAAKYLGISIRSLADLQAKRIVSFSKLGARTCLFKISDLDATVASFRQDAIGGAQ